MITLLFLILGVSCADLESYLGYFRSVAGRGEWIGQTRSINNPPVFLPYLDLEIYQKYTRLIYTSYCKGNIENWSCGVCNGSQSPVRNTSHVSEFHYGPQIAHGNVGVSHNLKTVFISFQGATHISQWLRCFDFLLVKAKEIGLPDSIRVHQGFYRVYKSIRGEISNLLFARTNKFPEYTISILGHSSGGALGSLLALDIAHGYLKNEFDVRKVNLITLGQPRVGNKAYAIAMDKANFASIARIVHSTDIFPHLVPRMKWIGLNYAHHKGEIWLDSSTAMWIMCEKDKMKEYDESPYCSNSVPWMKRTGHAHISYTTKNQTVTCPSRPQDYELDVEYLPNHLQ